MRILGILDPLKGPQGPYNLNKDTSHLLLWEFQRRGHEVFLADLAGLQMRGNRAWVAASRVHVHFGTPYFEAEEPETQPASDFRLILMRQDPPVDAAYLHATQILASVPPSSWVCNRPEALSRWNEKLMILNFPRWIPPTVVAASPEALEEFARAQGGKIVLKALIGFGSRDVRLADVQDSGWRESVNGATENGRRTVMAQAYLPAVHQGEKRIFFLDGKPLGALLRIPKAGSFLANPDLGARLGKTGLTGGEKRLCADLAPFLRKNGIFFAGVDAIGGKLTEINITSPGMLWEWNEVDGTHHEREIVDLFERKMRKR